MKTWRSILLGTALCCGFAAVLSFWKDNSYLAADNTVLLPETEPKYVALTFDDGPRAGTTERLLDGLAARGVKATFFLIGEQLEANAQLVQRMAAEGHQIGNHTWSHVRLSEADDATATEQLTRSDTALRTLLGEDDYWIRVPYGLIRDDQRPLFSQPLIQWSLDPEDWKDRDVQRITDDVLSRVRDGDILLFHDIYNSSVDAVIQITDALLDRGYCFVTVEQLLKSRNISLENGRIYRSAQ